ncbi:hypothetical protein NFI96_011018 [Prochilodus magdalenae]|nr:hypothetical protein NFI96_011018 [Prochilodus magdalenae]
MDLAGVQYVGRDGPQTQVQMQPVFFQGCAAQLMHYTRKHQHERKSRYCLKQRSLSFSELTALQLNIAVYLYVRPPVSTTKYLHTFPSDAENRHKWIVAIRRENFTVTPYTRVCSRHFKKEDVREPESKSGRRLLQKGAVPMLFEGNNFPVPLSSPGVWERRKRPTEDDTPVKEADTLPGDHDYASAPDPAAVDLVLEENTLLREEILQLKQQTEKLTLKHRFGIHRFAGSDSDIRFYTR